MKTRFSQHILDRSPVHHKSAVGGGHRKTAQGGQRATTRITPAKPSEMALFKYSFILRRPNSARRPVGQVRMRAAATPPSRRAALQAWRRCTHAHVTLTPTSGESRPRSSPFLSDRVATVVCGGIDGDATARWRERSGLSGVLTGNACLTVPLQEDEADRCPGDGCQGRRAHRLPLRHQQTVDAGGQEAESCGEEKEKGVCGACGPGRLVGGQRGQGEEAAPFPSTDHTMQTLTFSFERTPLGSPCSMFWTDIWAFSPSQVTTSK